MKKKILITGGGGFIGGHLVNFYQQKGYNVSTVDIKNKKLWFQINPKVKNINAGVAATLMGISPILIIPFSRIFEKEAITKNGIIGALLSTAGVAILFLP